MAVPERHNDNEILPLERDVLVPMQEPSFREDDPGHRRVCRPGRPADVLRRVAPSKSGSEVREIWTQDHHHRKTPYRARSTQTKTSPVDFAIWIERVGHYAIEVKGGKYCPTHRIGGERTS